MSAFFIEVKFCIIWHIFATFAGLTSGYEQMSHKIVITLYNIFKLLGVCPIRYPKCLKSNHDVLMFMCIKLWINLLGQALLFHPKPHILLFFLTVVSHLLLDLLLYFCISVGYLSKYTMATFAKFLSKNYSRRISNLGTSNKE